MARATELAQAGEEANTAKIFLELNPPDKKHRVVGLGSCTPLFVKNTIHEGSSSNTQPLPEELSECLEQMSEDNAKLKEDLQAERDARLKLEDQQKTDQEKARKLEETVEQLRGYVLNNGLVPT